MKKLLAIGACSLLLGCCSTNTQPIESPTPTIVAESVTPAITNVADGNRQLEKVVQNQSKTIFEQRREIERALQLADEMKKQLAEALPIREVTVNNLVESLNVVKARNLFLESENGDMGERLIRQELAIQSALTDSIKKDAQVTELQGIVGQQKEIIKSRNNTITALQKDITKLQKQNANYKVYKNWVVGIVVAVVLWTILKNVLMFYFPAVKFRI